MIAWSLGRWISNYPYIYSPFCKCEPLKVQEDTISGLVWYQIVKPPLIIGRELTDSGAIWALSRGCTKTILKGILSENACDLEGGAWCASVPWKHQCRKLIPIVGWPVIQFEHWHLSVWLTRVYRCIWFLTAIQRTLHSMAANGNKQNIQWSKYQLSQIYLECNKEKIINIFHPFKINRFWKENFWCW